ncbi:hypothetical protein HKX48_004505 [Thoreauomyces humboldtii]|nr:hypothetical protein HKX48_004505 [Thoreauomyces humboldtii]
MLAPPPTGPPPAGGFRRQSAQDPAVARLPRQLNAMRTKFNAAKKAGVLPPSTSAGPSKNGSLEGSLESLVETGEDMTAAQHQPHPVAPLDTAAHHPTTPLYQNQQATSPIISAETKIPSSSHDVAKPQVQQQPQPTANSGHVAPAARMSSPSPIPMVQNTKSPTAKNSVASRPPLHPNTSRTPSPPSRDPVPPPTYEGLNDSTFPIFSGRNSPDISPGRSSDSDATSPVRELIQKLRRLEDKLADVEDELEDAKEELALKNTLLEETNDFWEKTTLETAQSLSDQSKKIMDGLAQEGREAEAERDAANAALREKTLQLESMRASETKLRKELQTCEAIAADGRKQIAALQAADRHAKEALEAARESETLARKELAELREVMRDGSHDRHQELEDRIETLEDRLEEKEFDIAEKNIIIEENTKAWEASEREITAALNAQAKTALAGLASEKQALAKLVLELRTELARHQATAQEDTQGLGKVAVERDEALAAAAATASELEALRSRLAEQDTQYRKELARKDSEHAAELIRKDEEWAFLQRETSSTLDSHTNQRLTELTVDRDRITRERDEARATVATLEPAFAQLKVDLNQMTQQVQDTERQRNSASLAAQQFEQDLESEKLNFMSLHGEYTELKRSMESGTNKDIEQLRAALDAKTREAASLSSKLADLEHTHAEVSQRHYAQALELIELKTHMTHQDELREVNGRVVTPMPSSPRDPAATSPAVRSQQTSSAESLSALTEQEMKLKYRKLANRLGDYRSAHAVAEDRVANMRNIVHELEVEVEELTTALDRKTELHQQECSYFEQIVEALDEKLKKAEDEKRALVQHGGVAYPSANVMDHPTQQQDHGYHQDYQEVQQAPAPGEPQEFPAFDWNFPTGGQGLGVFS